MMLRERSSIQGLAIGLTDAALVACAFLLGYYLRFGSLLAGVGTYVWLLFVFMPVLVFLLNHYELLRVDHGLSADEIVLRAAKAFLITGVLLSGLIFVAQAKYYSRLLLAYAWAFGMAFVLAEKLLLRYLSLKRILPLAPARSAALISEGDDGREVERLLRSGPQYELGSNAVLQPTISPRELRDYLVSHPVDEVVVALSSPPPRTVVDLEELVRVCEGLGVPVKVLVGTARSLSHFSCSFTTLGGMPMLAFHPLHVDPDRTLLKRVMDLAGAVVGLCFTALLFPVVAVLIWHESKGPVLFRQVRVGQNGRLFTMLKFRTMHEGAESLATGLADRNEMAGPVFKMSDDPRLTRVGKLLRRLSLDELPQFWNVLKGEMSLVGTRPPTPDEMQEYELWHYRRVSIRPGITGLWQVSGRCRIKDFDRIVGLDLEYIDNWSLWLDVKILVRTVWVVLAGAGAL